MLTFADPLLHAEKCFADATAIVDGERRSTFREIAARCRRLAAALRRDSQRGDRVALLATNSQSALEVILATPCAGRIVVPMNGRLAVPELVS